MLQTIFDGGRRRASSRGALASYDSTVASYRQTSLIAFQEVEDNLAALRILDQEAQQQTVATASAQKSLQIFTNRYIGGAYPYLPLLPPQHITLQNQPTHLHLLLLLL